ncbi:MAG: DEAD/DEAH box helicase [Desulfovibrionaceae bacterium]
MTTSFAALGLSPALLQGIEDLGFEEPSPIQTLAVPALLAGRDAVGQAQTGTGKTAAFGLPLLERMGPERRTQGIVLCPTRELAIQVAEELGRLAVHRKDLRVLPVYGGQSIERQFRALAQGPQVIVGTPGRIIDHLHRGTLHLEETAVAVLDEADEMLDMGFREDIEEILEKTPENCQRVLFSATMPPAIRALADRFLRDPEVLAVPHRTQTAPAIEQVYYEVRQHQKGEALCRLLDAQNFRKALVFCSTKRGVDDVTLQLQRRGYQADGLHGNLSQSQRDRVMGRFREEGLDVLVATDVAARGIDVDDVDAVINYDIPHDVESYVHRIGRTGRAGREGRAFTFVTAREHFRLRDIMRCTKASISRHQLPTLHDLHHLRTAKVLDEVLETLAAGPQERWIALVEEFLGTHFPEGRIASRDVAAALLKLLVRRDFGGQDIDPGHDPLAEAPRRAPRAEERRESGSDTARRPPRRHSDTPMTRIRISVGRAHSVKPGMLVGAIAGECGIPGGLVGAIDIAPRFSVVEVASSVAEEVLAILNAGVFICGTKITAEPWLAAPPPRKPHAPGARRRPSGASPQRPGRSGGRRASGAQGL